MGCGRAAEKGENPGWCSLRASYKAFGSELKSVRTVMKEREKHTIPVDGSTTRESVSTATT